jgi:site-specific DNA recombinase
MSLLEATLEQARALEEGQIQELEQERRAAERELTRLNRAIRSAAIDANGDSRAAARLADLQAPVRDEEMRLAENHRQIDAAQGRLITRDDLKAAMTLFDPVWDALSPREQARVFQLLIRRVEYDGEKGAVSITFRPDGIKSLANGGMPA